MHHWGWRGMLAVGWTLCGRWCWQRFRLAGLGVFAELVDWKQAFSGLIFILLYLYSHYAVLFHYYLHWNLCVSLDLCSCGLMHCQTLLQRKFLVVTCMYCRGLCGWCYLRALHIYQFKMLLCSPLLLLLRQLLLKLCILLVPLLMFEYHDYTAVLRLFSCAPLGVAGYACCWLDFVWSLMLAKIPIGWAWCFRRARWLETGICFLRCICVSMKLGIDMCGSTVQTGCWPSLIVGGDRSVFKLFFVSHGIQLVVWLAYSLSQHANGQCRSNERCASQHCVT